MSRLCTPSALACAAVAFATALAGCAKGTSATAADAAVDARPPSDAAPDANMCATQPCSILPQCGCAGQTACDVDVSDYNGTACRSILMPGTETAACSANTECDAGYVCLGGASYASCKKYCTVDGDCGTPRGKCIFQLTSNSVPIPDVPKTCSSNCDPTDTMAAGCPPTFKCTLFSVNDGTTTHRIVDCSLAGLGDQGDDCTTNGQGQESKCAKGHQCVKLSNEATYKCRRICTNPGAASAQCNGQQCIGYVEPHTVGGVTYGICAP